MIASQSTFPRDYTTRHVAEVLTSKIFDRSEHVAPSRGPLLLSTRRRSFERRRGAKVASPDAALVLFARRLSGTRYARRTFRSLIGEVCALLFPT